MLSVYAATVVYDYKIILRGTKFERTTKPQSLYFTFVTLKRLMLYITTFFQHYATLVVKLNAIYTRSY